jgi:hypothetical protein
MARHIGNGVPISVALREALASIAIVHEFNRCVFSKRTVLQIRRGFFGLLNSDRSLRKQAPLHDHGEIFDAHRTEIFSDSREFFQSEQGATLLQNHML